MRELRRFMTPAFITKQIKTTQIYFSSQKFQEPHSGIPILIEKIKDDGLKGALEAFPKYMYDLTLVLCSFMSCSSKAKSVPVANGISAAHSHPFCPCSSWQTCTSISHLTLHMYSQGSHYKHFQYFSHPNFGKINFL